ncbi:hypothetical protein GCM10009422_23850 [Brevundimonas kwangchunensis]|uniref:Uncharacterized protein n=1 Tax=Brevundimonas kwangchunensis TaxID=322163 RepID=A0ABN1H1F1_9CAUL
MRIVALAVAAALAGVAVPALAQDNAPAPAPAPAPVRIEEWPTARVAAMGQAIFEQDRAASVATDAFVAHFNRQPPADLTGWVVTPERNAQRVRFLRADGEGVKSGWDVVVRNGVAGSVEEAATPLSEAEQAQFRARNTAATNVGRLRCSSPMNAVVLDDPQSDGWLVWLLTSTTDANIVPVGGHYRFHISADGGTVVRRDILSNTCLDMPRPQRSAQGQPVGMVVSQIVSDGPVETHVFLSLQNRLTIFVLAGEKVFQVNGARIREVRR